MDCSHLNALNLRLHNETVRLNNATNPNEIALRTVWVDGIKDEIKREREFLGLPSDKDVSEMSDDELLKELLG